MNNQVNKYRGKVHIAFKTGNKIVRQSTHNTGLSDMALLFAKAITGNLQASTDVPRVIDVGYVVPSTTNDTITYSNGVWQSILNEPINIGGRQYKFDKSLDNWVGILVATLYYSDLNGGILDNVLDNAEAGQISLKVRLCSYDVVNRKYFAEIDVSPDEIREIKDATSAIFTWYTELIYAEEGNSSTLVGNVINA